MWRHALPNGGVAGSQGGGPGYLYVGGSTILHPF